MIAMTKMFTNNKNCADCVYKGIIANEPHCAYIFKTGHSRGCPPGDECTKKVGYRKRLYPKKGERNG